MSKVLVLGLPKTGTTGLFKRLVDNISNCQPIFEPASSELVENFITNKPLKNLVVKIMLREKYLSESFINRFDLRICIYRDPRDRIISQLLFKPLSRPALGKDCFQDFIKILNEKIKYPNMISVKSMSERMNSLSIGGLNFKSFSNDQKKLFKFATKNNFDLINYDDFINEKFSNFPFLTKTANPQKEIMWLDHIVRSKNSGDWKRWFNKEDIIYFKDILGEELSSASFLKEQSLDWNLSKEQPTYEESVGYLEKKFPSRLRQFYLQKTSHIESIDDLKIILERAKMGRPIDIAKIIKADHKLLSELNVNLDEYKNLLRDFDKPGFFKSKFRQT